MVANEVNKAQKLKKLKEEQKARKEDVASAGAGTNGIIILYSH